MKKNMKEKSELNVIILVYMAKILENIVECITKNQTNTIPSRLFRLFPVPSQAHVVLHGWMDGWWWQSWWILSCDPHQHSTTLRQRRRKRKGKGNKKCRVFFIVFHRVVLIVHIYLCVCVSIHTRVYVGENLFSYMLVYVCVPVNFSLVRH